LKLYINNGAGDVDYTRYVTEGSLSIRDSINVPVLLNFNLDPTNASFIVPRRSAYVRVISDVYGPNTGYGSGKVLATGFVTSEPDREFLGLGPKTPQFKQHQYRYSVKVTSDEWLLNTKVVPYIPAFVNQTDSQILSAIASTLCPGFFSVSGMASGTLVPYFQYDPAQTWSDIAKTFADANRFHYKVINRQIYYQPFGDAPLGIAYNEATQRGGQLSPFELKTSVVTVPPVNDCTVIGDTEPQNNVDNYFIGDGFESNFIVRHPVFDGSSTLLLSDDWTENAFDRGTWTVQDPLNVFALIDGGGQAVGALNINQKGANGIYTPQTSATFIQAKNGLELGGGINLQHGQFTFTDACNGIIGGIYGTNSFVPGNCLAGFGITGQKAVQAVTVISVQHDANSQFVTVVLSGGTTLQPGNVVVGAGFGSATFLNGTKLSVNKVVGNVVTLIGLTIYSTAYGPTADNGTLTANANDVLVTASGSAGIVIGQIYNGAYLGTSVGSQVVATINGKSIPYDPALNPTYTFDQSGGAGNAPTSIPVVAGQSVTFQYQSGTVSMLPSVFGYYDANGNPTVDGSTTGYPGFYCPAGTRAGGLIGAWANAGGVLVAAPFFVGDSFAGTAPPGATQLLLGCNDKTIFSDNDGSWTMGITLAASQQVITQINHQYVLQTWIGANTQSRYTRPFSNLTRTKTYGNQNLASQGAISWVITDYDQGLYVVEQRNPLFGLFPAAAPPVVYKSTVFGAVLPPFALYCLVNAINLNLAANYTVLSLPPQGFLTVQSLTGASGGSLPWLPSQLGNPAHYQLGFGMINQTAQITQSGEVYELSFYSDNIPSVGARIRFQSWAAGQSAARVRDSVAISAEAAISGDDGVRSAIMTNISPLPRSSDECEAAAAAAIHDREFPQFQGSYGQKIVPFKDESFFAPSVYQYPRTGEYLYINAPFRGISGQNFFVNEVNIQVEELRQEVMNIDINFGPDLYLEKILTPFLGRENNILTPQQTAPAPDYITLPEVLNAFLATLDNAQVTSIVNSATGNYITVDLGAPPASACEVRNVDSGWGIANQGRIGVFTSQVFTLPRTVRDQTFYLRTLNGAKFSRFSKALRVVYPLVPSAPGLVQADVTKAVFAYTGDVRDIYGLELRVTPISGVNFFNLPAASVDGVSEFIRSATPPSASYQHNVIAVYNPTSFAATFPYGLQLIKGDIIIVQSPGDTSFGGIQIVSDIIQSSAAQAPVFPTRVTLNGANAYIYPNLQSDLGFEKSFPVTPAQAVLTRTGLSSLKFNAMLGMGGDPSVQPMQVDVYDSNGVFHGRTEAGSTQGYDMIVSGSFFIPAPGSYTFTITHDDGMIFGIEGGTRVSGLMGNPSFSQTQTAMLGLPILGMNNRSGFFPNEQYVVSFAASGTHRFEIDYDQWIHAQTLQVQCNGNDIFPTPPNIGQGGTTGNPWEFGFWDYGQPTPDSVGSLNHATPIATVQLLKRGNPLTLTTGQIAANYSGVCRLGTTQAHGFSIGDTVIIGCGWGAWSAPGVATPPSVGAVFCGQQVITSVPSSTSFEFVIQRFTSSATVVYGSWEQQAASVGVPSTALVGVCCAMPATQSFATASGVILQRPVFAPSDLIVDFSQPDLAQTLELVQLLSSSNRVAGVKAYFFNLTWDYSLPTPIPAFEIPSITDVFVDTNTQTINWTVATGQPKGYRVTVKDPVSNTVYNTFTVDNPLNTQPLTQFKMLSQDFLSDRLVTVTPFDGLGDGLSTNVPAGGFGAGGGVASPFGYSIHFMENRLTVTGQIVGRAVFDYPVTYYQNFLPSQAWLDLVSDTPMVLSIQKFSLVDGTQDTGEEVGCLVFPSNSHTGVFTAPATGVDFQPGEVIKVIQSAYAGNGQGMAITLSGLLNPTASVQATSSGSSPIVPPTSGSSEDMMDWVVGTASERANFHYKDSQNSVTNPMYGYWDGGNKWWHLKGKLGNPWDLNLVDSTYLYLWITENGDQNAWSNASAYKRNNVSHGNPTPQGFPYIPRNFTIVTGGDITIDTPAPNPVVRTLNCEADGQPLIQLGPVRCITRQPVTTAWGRSIGTVPTIVVEYYYGGGTPYHLRERFHFVKGVGIVQWDYASGTFGGSYTISQTSKFVDKIAGGGVIPNFPCSAGPPSWWL
jgi:hypothetical protein